MSSPAQPPRLPIPNGRQLTVKLSHDGQPANVVLGFQGAGAWTGSGVAETVVKAFWDAFRPLVVSSVTCEGGVWRDVSVASGQVYESGPYSATTAARTGGATIAAASVLVKWSTAQGGRSGKGRLFLPGLSGNDQNPSGRGYNASLATATAAAISAYLGSAALSSAGLTPAVLSFRKGAAYAITGGALAPTIGIQRRRMR